MVFVVLCFVLFFWGCLQTAVSPGPQQYSPILTTADLRPRTAAKVSTSNKTVSGVRLGWKWIIHGNLVSTTTSRRNRGGGGGCRRRCCRHGRDSGCYKRDGRDSGGNVA